MRDKTSSGILALLLGWLGVHRFYLGQPGLGVVYVLLTLFTGGIVSGILSIIDAIKFLTMDREVFDRKYNANIPGALPSRPGQVPARGFPQPKSRPTNIPVAKPRNMKVPTRDMQNPFKINGIKKYKEFDLEGAIEDFKKGLEIHPNDISLHFNIACAYSLTEQVDKAYEHLDRAVALGFNDFEKIKTHDDLAFVRIQDRFDEFQKNGYRLTQQSLTTPAADDNNQQAATPMDDLLLSQLRRLAELRDRGLLTEQEFMNEKKKLTR